MTRKVFAGVSVAVLGSLAVAGAAFAQGPFARGPLGRGPLGRGNDWHRDGHPMMWGIGLMVLIAATAALVTWLVLRGRPAAAGAAMAAPSAPVASASPTASAETILAERLARSEIGPDDYRSMLAALRGGVVSPTSLAPEPPASA